MTEDYEDAGDWTPTSGMFPRLPPEALVYNTGKVDQGDDMLKLARELSVVTTKLLFGIRLLSVWRRRGSEDRFVHHYVIFLWMVVVQPSENRPYFRTGYPLTLSHGNTDSLVGSCNNCVVLRESVPPFRILFDCPVFKFSAEFPPAGSK